MVDIAIRDTLVSNRVKQFAQYLYDLHHDKIHEATLRSVIFGDWTRVSIVDGEITLESIPMSTMIQIEQEI